LLDAVAVCVSGCAWDGSTAAATTVSAGPHWYGLLKHHDPLPAHSRQDERMQQTYQLERRPQQRKSCAKRG